MNLVDYFLKEVTEEKTSIAYLKAKTLGIIVSITTILVFVLMIRNILTKNYTDAIVGVIIILSTTGVLFLIKKGKVALAGSFITLAVLLLEAFSMIASSYTTVMPYEFYVFFILIVVAAMFTPRYIFVSIYILIIGSTFFWYFKNKDLFPVDLQSFIQYSFIVYQVMILMNLLFSFIFTNFLDKAIENVSKKNKKINEHNRVMQEIAEKVKISSIQLVDASSQLSSISQQISQSTSEQAASTEEISSFMEQMLVTITSNTEKAENTSQIASESAKKIEQNKDMIIHSLNLVNEISNKTLIISEIADKTDILSINAAIEAARAGESGKGFAVVAQEIRKLADITKSASKEIEESSIKNQKTSQISSKELEKVIPKIIKSAQLINNITVASREQQTSVDAINQAIQQLTGITNENSASAEEMSVSAEELSSQAEQLNEIISLFKID